MTFSVVIAAILSAIATHLMIKRGGVRTDVPNARSSHSTPTPRGGGFAISIGLISGIFHAAMFGLPAVNFAKTTVIVVICFVSICLLLGLAEDRFGISAKWRLAIEIGAAAVLISIVGAWPLPAFLEGRLLIGSDCLLIFVLTTAWLVWTINYFNFMDGINGISASQAMISFMFYGYVAVISGELAVAVIALCGSGALIGFLPFNFPRAKIFMGDSGSLFLGSLVAALPLLLARTSPERMNFLIGIMPVSPFIMDSCTTLIRRVLTRQRITEAHRTHSYQLMAISLNSHVTVTATFVGLALIGSGLGCWMVAKNDVMSRLFSFLYLGILAAIFGLAQFRYLRIPAAAKLT